MPSLIGKIEPGDVIGRCRVIRELGRGGVGTVYLATHQTLQIEVALKVLSPAVSMENPALAERFIRESQLAARIRHPNVIAVMDAAQDDATGLYYIVLEYVGGGSLSWHLRNGPLPEAKALAIMTGIANALVIAEESQIVHRDIKPDNIMLDLRGTAKLADLGLAKHAIDSQISLTLGGSFMGTPAYMSPEQARDAKVADTRDDIYSLGATFFECLTGAAPFQGETPYNIMSELLTKPSPIPRVFRPDLSRSVDAICRKMMAKTRDLRYANAHSLLRELEHCRIYGDSGFNQLEAASFDHDSIMIQQQALDYGIETSVDGVAVVPDLPEDSEVGPITRKTPALAAPRRSDYGVFGAAALLVAMVTVATLALAWIGPHRPLAYLQTEFNKLTGTAVVTPPLVAETPVVPQTPKKPKKTPVPTEPASTVDPTHSPKPQPTPTLEPVPLPLQPNFPPTPTPSLEITNAVPALPVDPNAVPTPIPAEPIAQETAFQARAIAEASLPPALISPTGQAELLKIVGKRDSTQVAPSSWVFYFYDKGAAGHAQIVTVTGGKVTKTGEDLVDIATPYKEENILPADLPLIDSPQVLQITSDLAASQAPNTVLSGSELVLSKQKNSVPMWNVTLWAKGPEGDGRKLGDVTILGEGGTVIKKKLNP